MGTDLLQGTTTNGDSVSLVYGMVTRIVANNTVARAQADSAAHLQGLYGVVISGSVAPGGPSVVQATNATKAKVLLEIGLTPRAGQTLYVSATVAGHATNVAPATAIAIGVIEDASSYAIDGRVYAAIEIAAEVVSTSEQNLVAQWLTGAANRRVYLVDGKNGNDANPGFLDGGSAVFPISAVTVAATAKKTVEALDLIFPRVGAGRCVEVIIANGGSNTTGVYTGGLHNFLTGVVGYDFKSLVRGTGTNTTAGATAFAGDANDATYLGGVTCAGCNAGGYTVIGTPSTTVVQLQKNGGGAASLPAEPAAPLGWRMRGDASGARNANVSIDVVAIGGAADTITVLTPYGTLPQVGDVFYLEQAGVQLTAAAWNGGGPGQFASNNLPMLSLAGIMNVGTNVTNAQLCFAFCGNLSAPGLFNCGITSRPFYAHPTLGTLTTGGGFHNVGNCFIGRGSTIDMHAHTCEGLLTIDEVSYLNWKNGNVVGAGATVNGCGGMDHPTVTSFGSAGVENFVPVRCIGGTGFVFNNCRAAVGALSVTGVGANPGLIFNASQVMQLAGGLWTGSAGNTGVGLSFPNTPTGASVVYTVNNVNTLTGAEGDVSMSDGTVVTWAQAAAGIIDTNGNEIYGLGAAPLGTKVASAATAVALGNVAPSTVTSSTPTAWTPLVINGVKYLVPLWPSS